MRVNVKFEGSSKENGQEKTKLPEKVENRTSYPEKAADRNYHKESGEDCCLESPFFKDYSGGYNDDHHDDHHGDHDGNHEDNGDHHDDCNNHQMLARAYVPDQCYGETYGPTRALITGTLFPELFRPYPC